MGRINPGKVLASTRTTRRVGVGFLMKVSVDDELTINSNKSIIRIKINTSSIAGKQIYICVCLCNSMKWVFYYFLWLISVLKMPRGYEVGLDFKTLTFFFFHSEQADIF